jgi:hypothetical protein
MAALYADRLALLAEGRLLALGPPSEVLTPERLTQVYGVPIVVAQHPLYGTPLVMPVIERDGVQREEVKKEIEVEVEAERRERKVEAVDTGDRLWGERLKVHG